MSTGRSRPPSERRSAPDSPSPLPYWAILLLVILGIGAMLALGLACAFVVSVL